MDESFELIETMCAEEGEVLWLDYHADRLRASAAHFGFSFDEKTFRERVQQKAEEAFLPTKIRALLNKTGTLNLSVSILQANPPGGLSVAISRHTINSSDPFYRHKTTRRTLYEATYQEAVAAGFDEVVFLNERGEVTEGSRTNLFIQQGENLWTPPESCGLLGGVCRRHILETYAKAGEKVIFLEDLLQAEAFFLCNAVRGILPVTRIQEEKRK